MAERPRPDQTERLVHDLRERVKELTALHAAAQLLNERGAPIDLLRRVVDLLPPAWQYPEIAAAHIAVADLDVRTGSFAATEWMQRAVFTTAYGEAGVIEVVYLEARPGEAEGPFLAEERDLIESIAELLRAYFDRLHAEEDRINLARVEAARAEAEQANRAKDEFLAMLSHELRSPLNVMLGWTRMLRTHRLEPGRVARGLEILERNVRLQSKLIEELLDVSRIVTGKLRVDLQTTDLVVVAGYAVDAARPAARTKHIALEATLPPSLLVRGDPPRLQQVISNLLTNAIKFTPEYGRVDVSMTCREDRACITIHDSGIGIAPDLLPCVFERFRQGDGSTTRAYGGLGLGLAIVKHLVELQDGRIEAASPGPGLGATFTITMPALRGEAVVAPPARAVSVDSKVLAGIRVLVVDAEEDDRATLAAILEEYGAHATAVASAREAVDSIARYPPDVLLSDIAMPGEDGFALIRRIRESVIGKGLPAAALSAYAETGSRAHALAAGFQEHLTKPIEPTALVLALAKLVHRIGESP